MQTNRRNPFGTGFASSPTRGEGSQSSSQQQPQQSQSMNMDAWSQPMQFGTVAEGQRQQDAFVQQFLQNQAQYNQGLRAGQQPQRVDVGQTWGQAGDNIASGAYQGNPFATGNVDAIMGLFGQYGIQAPEGFRDQLIQNLGQQSTPPALSQAGQQPLTSHPAGPNGEYWPGAIVPISSGLPTQASPQIGGGPVQTGAPHWQPQIGTPVARNPWAPKWGDPGYPVPGMGQQPVTRPQMPEGPLADWGFRPFVEPPRTPEQQARDAEMMRRAEEASARLRREQQQARLMSEMQARYPTMDPVYARRNGQDQMVGWQPNQQRTAEAVRQQEQRLLDQGYIEGPRKSNGEKTWISPQQQAHREEQFRSRPSQAQPIPERSEGTRYTPPAKKEKTPPKTTAKDRAKAQALMRSMGMR